MKNLKTLLLVALLAVGVASCKKDENASSNNTAIVGKWVLATEAVKVYRNGVKTQDTVYVYSDRNVGYTEYKADGKGMEYETDGGTDSFTYTLQNDGKKLINIYSDGDKDEYDIKLLNNSNLVLYWEDERIRDGVTSKYIAEYTYNRK